jgi:hypothetical protein
VFGRLKEEPPPQSYVGTTGPVPAAADGEHRGPPEGLILLLFAILTLAASAFVLQRAEHHALHDPAQKAVRGEVAGLGSDSFFRAPNLRRALAKVETGPQPLITRIRVSATRVDVTVRDADGNQKLLSYDLDLNLKQFDWGSGDDASVRAGQIDAAAPERMVRIVAERTGLGAGAVDYVTESFPQGSEHNWYMSLSRGPVRLRQWIAAPDGSDLRKPGELSQAQKNANAKRQREFQRQQRRLKRTFARRDACLRRATDAVAAGRCLQRFP